MKEEALARELRRCLLMIARLFEQQLGIVLDIEITVKVRNPPQ